MSETYTGSCLCKKVTYKLVGEPMRFYHCHCERCRKATGTGHATNIMVKPDTDIEWLTGEELLGRYKVPEAERFYNCFCKECGSPMPRVIPELGSVLIAAGSLDMIPEMKPQGRIFWGSRVEWSCDDKALPVFDEYPPGI